MISCRDVNNLQMDGMELVAGAAGLDRIVSWTYLVQTNEKLKRLEMYDNANGSFLIDTLLNYYMCGFNVGKTAQMMYVHRNSLQYRLKKIEEILEISLDDSMEYLDVVNCILVKRLMFN